MYWFTADQHYGHEGKAPGYGIIAYCGRPWKSVEEMDEALIENHNKVVGNGDVVVNAGDFSWYDKRRTVEIIKRLNGQQVFLRGSHDHWLQGSCHEIWSRTIEGIHLEVCHWPIARWERSHYGSWHLYGHVHGRYKQEGKAWDIGVDNNLYFPVGWEEVKNIMKGLPDNPNLIKKE